MANLPLIESLRGGNALDGAATGARRGRDSLLARFNGPFLLVVLLLACYGLVVVWSATYSDIDYDFKRQAAGVAVGVVLMLAVWQVGDRKRLH